MSAIVTRRPWQLQPLDQWSVVGMNHYYVMGRKQLYVAMMKDDVVIKEEGEDDEYLWNRLWHKAVKYDTELKSTCTALDKVRVVLADIAYSRDMKLAGVRDRADAAYRELFGDPEA